MKTPNEYLENTFKSLETTEKFQKWITAKQVNFFTNVCNLKKSSHFRANQTSSLNYVGETDKYNINIYISPVNKAGSITIINKTIQNEKTKELNNDRINELNEKIIYLKTTIEEVEKKPLEEWNKFDKLYIPGMKKDLEKHLKEVEQLQR
ncbi:hypothetical protein P4V41_07350 [Fictibacillus nanhaiensis]|uniref:hypothetical protein n=1 Tax=Fictibacillus nanhaiensis TaxID=742169 RepID=UPI002E1F4843|nr:hypothetical protein [Fictibacillus nanhaiensis]